MDPLLSPQALKEIKEALENLEMAIFSLNQEADKAYELGDNQKGNRNHDTARSLTTYHESLENAFFRE